MAAERLAVLALCTAACAAHASTRWDLTTHDAGLEEAASIEDAGVHEAQADADTLDAPFACYEPAPAVRVEYIEGGIAIVPWYSCCADGRGICKDTALLCGCADGGACVTSQDPEFPYVYCAGGE